MVESVESSRKNHNISCEIPLNNNTTVKNAWARNTNIGGNWISVNNYDQLYYAFAIIKKQDPSVIKQYIVLIKSNAIELGSSDNIHYIQININAQRNAD